MGPKTESALPISHFHLLTFRLCHYTVTTDQELSDTVEDVISRGVQIELPHSKEIRCVTFHAFF